MSADQIEDCQSEIDNLGTLTPKQLRVLRLRCSGVELSDQQRLLNISAAGLRQLWKRTRDNLGIPSAYDGDFPKRLQEYCNCLDSFDLVNTAAKPEDNVSELLPDVSKSGLSIMLPSSGLSMALARATSTAIRHNNLRELIQLADDPYNAEYFQQEAQSTRRRRIQAIAFAVTIVAVVLLLTLGGTVGYLLHVAQPVTTAPRDRNILESASASVTTPANATTIMVQPTLSVTGECMIVAPSTSIEPLRAQGITQFTPINTNGGVLSGRTRTLAVDKDGVFAGYFANGDFPGGVGLFDRQNWRNCGMPGEGNLLNVNALAVDHEGNLWAASENNGILKFDGKVWRNFGFSDGLPTLNTYGVTVDPAGSIWAATYEGIAKFDGHAWSEVYSVENHTLVNNHVHAVAFDGQGNIWVGYIDKGLSILRKSTGEWEHFNKTLIGQSKISGDGIRAIVIQPRLVNSSEIAWVATSDGGLMAYQNSSWRFYRVADGLPSDEVLAVAIDHYSRPWVATGKGVAYLFNGKWETYHMIPALSVAFGPACSQPCPYDEEHVWTGLSDGGLTHSRVPFNEPTIDYVGVHFFRSTGEEVPSPPVFKPGEKFRLEVDVRPRVGYELRQDRGDALWSLDVDSARFGAYPQIAVKGTIEPGQTYPFTDYDNLFTVPDLPSGLNENVFSVHYRTWMWTRATGPVITIQFTVRR
jgi:hypothetical protein